MSKWSTDEELFKLMRAELATCPVSDVMGQLGFLHPMLPPEIRPLRNDMVMVGRAMPVQDEAPVPYGSPTRFDAKPFGLLAESIDALRPNEVYIAAGGPVETARVGDMNVTRAQRLGAAGLVLNAYVRDGNGIAALGIPAFARGSYAYAIQGRHNVVDFRCPIMFGEVRIKPGDLIFGDGDGVCVIPREAEQEIIVKALSKNQVERNVRKAIEAGESFVDAFKRYGVM
jgi:4-hydroxy-4-methyl-2-oxoglutarate aldolase